MGGFHGGWLGRKTSFDATIRSIDGGSSSVAERLSVAQDVVGSIPTRRPIQNKRLTHAIYPVPACDDAVHIESLFVILRSIGATAKSAKHA
jgi:hypothetical protein